MVECLQMGRNKNTNKTSEMLLYSVSVVSIIIGVLCFVKIAALDSFYLNVGSVTQAHHNLLSPLQLGSAGFCLIVVGLVIIYVVKRKDNS